MAVTMGELLALRDETVKNAVLAAMPASRRPQIAAVLDDAFQRASQFWLAEHLPELIGSEAAADLPELRFGERGHGRELSESR
jgi:hypothetical protein